MKDILYSDLHLREDRVHIHDEIHDKIFEVADKEGVIKSGGSFINCGDTFHVRGLIRTSCFDLLYRKRKEWHQRGLKRHIDIIGNHDQEDKDGLIHPMRVFEQFGPEWYVVDKPTHIKDKFCDFHAFPYMAHLDKELKKISMSKRSGSVALVHTGIHGAFKNDGDLDDFSIHTEVFKGFKRVFSGHYHNRQLYDGIVQYVGSPVQHNFSEMDQEKGVLIYDRKTNKVKFVAIDGPKHHHVEVRWEDGKKVVTKTSDKIRERDIVRVRVFGDSTQVSTVQRDDFDFKCASVKIERKTKDAVSSRIKTDGSDKELLEQYIDYVDPELDQGRLLKIGSKFMEVSHA